jgi:hypothetical protein
MDGPSGDYVDEKRFPPGTTVFERVLGVEGNNKIIGWSDEYE